MLPTALNPLWNQVTQRTRIKRSGEIQAAGERKESLPSEGRESYNV